MVNIVFIGLLDERMPVKLPSLERSRCDCAMAGGTTEKWSTELPRFGFDVGHFVLLACLVVSDPLARLLAVLEVS